MHVLVKGQVDLQYNISSLALFFINYKLYILIHHFVYLADTKDNCFITKM